MGVDYVVELSCPVKDALSTATLVQLVKGRNNANTILALHRRDGDLRPPAAIEFGRAQQRLQDETMNVTMTNVSAQTLLDQAAPLEEYEHFCQGCPANVRREPFGCYGYLSYPISADIEQWLLARLPENLDSTAGRYLRAAVEDFSYDGGMITNMRKHSTFFERNRPERRTWRKGLHFWRLTSDQLLQMMIGLGNLGAAHCSMLALFLGVVPHDSPADLVRDQVAWRKALAQARVGPGEGSPKVRPWISFVNALATAAALDVQILIDS